ncbi:MAG: hypothetical protein OXN89_12160 [Bryobacterales bacterium]|nr:hypothetical protein [Bryobacterales bacterium]
MSSKGNQSRCSDEELASELLRDYLAKHFGGAPCCERATDDPPDLVATLATGVRWGVEVTRAYQQVPLPGKDELGSTEAVMANLTRWAEDLGVRTAGFRMRRYVLHLGPGVLSLTGETGDLFDTQWNKEAEARIRNHIESDLTSTLRGRGLWLKARGEGKGWACYVSPGGSAQIDFTIAQMLSHTLSKKAGMVRKWKGCFDQRWLLVLNHYPLADDDNEVRSIVQRLAQNDRSIWLFDGILWYSRAESCIVPVWERRRIEIA